MESLIKKLRTNKVLLSVNGDQLDIHFDGDSLPADLIQELKDNKQALIEYIQAKTTKKNFQQIPALPQQESYPLSSSQHRSWLLSQFEEANPAYNMPVSFIFKGQLNRSILEKTFDELIDRHEVLRTVFKDDEHGEIRQYIKDRADLGFQIVYQDLEKEVNQKKVVEPIILKEITEPFDLYHGPLIRARLIRLAPDRHLFSYVMHHIVGDAMSGDLLQQEIALLYKTFARGEDNPLPPLRIQYKDYASWQQSELSSTQQQKEKEYWIKQFDGEVPTLQMATDFPRPPVKTYNGTRLYQFIPQETIQNLKAVLDRAGCTLFMGLIGLVNTLLHRYSGQHDIVLGSPISGRNHTDLKTQIGFYINTLALRSQIDPNQSFNDLLQQIKKTTIGAYEHQMYSFDDLVNQLSLKRDMSRNPLFDVFVILQGTEMQYEEPEDFDELMIEAYEGKKDVYSYFDLTLVFADSDDFLFTFEYNSDIYRPETAQRMARHFEQLISAVAQKPDAPLEELVFLKPEEQQQLLHDFNPSQSDYPRDQTFLDLFQQQVQKNPTRTALVFEGQALTYQELNERSNQLAHYLLSKGLEKEALVAICLDRSIEMMVALLAVAKCGAAYIPLDPAYPAERIEYILEDAAVRWAISRESDQEALLAKADLELVLLDVQKTEIEAQAKTVVDVIVQASDLVYVIYTSGSTGKPKGVLIEHRSLMNFLCSMQKQLAVDAQSSLLAVTTYSFDISYLELYLPLISGAQIILAGSETTADGYFLQELLAHYQPSHMQATPATWQLLIDCGWTNEERTMILCGGEAIKEDLKNQLCGLSDQQVWNLYGPTETTIWSTAQRLTPNQKVNIGRPIANTEIYILNTANAKMGRHSIVPLGVAGELCIGGEGLARAYLNRPELTAEKFIPHPFKEGARLYRTGDLAKWLPNGDIACLGRIDNQVKIRGYRIEPGEIETVLQQQDSVKQAVVIAKEDRMGSNRLIAYLQTADHVKKEVNKNKLQSALKGLLPSYMVPSVFVELSEFPLTPNGKINRLALPDPDDTSVISQEYVAPISEFEIQLTQVWQDLLGLDKIGIHDDFFQLGGHSLLATRVISNIRKTFDLKLSIRTLFELTTVAELAQHLEALKAQEETVPFDNKFII